MDHVLRYSTGTSSPAGLRCTSTSILSGSMNRTLMSSFLTLLSTRIWRTSELSVRQYVEMRASSRPPPAQAGCAVTTQTGPCCVQLVFRLSDRYLDKFWRDPIDQVVCRLAESYPRASWIDIDVYPSVASIPARSLLPAVERFLADDKRDASWVTDDWERVP